MIEDIFDILGHSEAETNIYLLLQKHGTSTGGQVAEYAGCPRPTAYKHLEKLARNGLVAKSSRRGVKLFSAAPPEKIKILYTQKIKKLTDQSSKVDQVVEKLSAQTKDMPSKPKMTFFEGKNEIESALLDMLLYPDITTRSFWSAHSAISAVSEDFWWYFNKERIQKNIQINGLWPQGRDINLLKYPFQGSHPLLKRDIRIAPAEFDTLMSSRIYANKVLSFSSEIENFCFIIESTEYVNMLSTLHQTIWNISKPYQSNPKEIATFIEYLNI